MRAGARKVGAKPMVGFRKLVDLVVSVDSHLLSRLTEEFERRGIKYRVHGLAKPMFAFRVWVHQRDKCIAETILQALQFHNEGKS